MEHYGHTRIMYGSDFPFGDPVEEYRKIVEMELAEAEKEAILMGNIQALLSDANRPGRVGSVSGE